MGRLRRGIASEVLSCVCVRLNAQSVPAYACALGAPSVCVNKESGRGINSLLQDQYAREQQRRAGSAGLRL